MQLADLLRELRTNLFVIRTLAVVGCDVSVVLMRNELVSQMSTSPGHSHSPQLCVTFQYHELDDH